MAPRYFIICRLNNMVRIPIATSIKKVEKPVTSISQNCLWIFHTNLLFPTTYGHFSDYIKKMPDKKQTFQSASYPAVASLNNSPSEHLSGIIAINFASVK